MFRRSELDRYTDLLGRLENSRAKNSVENMLNQNFNQAYRPGLVPGSMRRGPDVRDIDFVHGQPAVGYDQPGGAQRQTVDRPIRQEGSMKGLRDSALVKARKEHQARLNAHSSKVHKLAKDF